MLSNTEVADELKELLLATMPNAAPASGGKFVAFRCRYCPDGKSPTSKHFYVGLGYDDNLPFFYCHLCHSTGIVTASVLQEWGAFDVDLSVKITQNNRRLFSLPKNRILKDRGAYKLNNVYISDNKLSEVKLMYVNKRIGSSLSYRDLLDLKIVLNLYDLLQVNNITTLTRHPNIVDEINKSFLGFISTDNAFVNLRNLRKGKVHKSIDKRYINYDIFNKKDNTKRFYIIPNEINLNDPSRIKIHISEGPFDILSIYLNLRKELYHNIYGAVCGSGFLGIIKHFINTLKLINIEFHIYKDNDMDDFIIYSICELLRPYMIPCYLHVNTFPGEKDFGVPVNKIKEVITKII